jgi:hypothetical protein
MSFHPPKRPTEQEYYGFDFAACLANGETINSNPAPVFTVTVVDGTDASSSALLSGSPVITGTVVSNLIVGGLNGVTYELACLVTTSTGQKIQLCETLPVETC